MFWFFFYLFIPGLQSNVLTWVEQWGESVFVHLFLLWAETWLSAYRKSFATASRQMLLAAHLYCIFKFPSILMDYDKGRGFMIQFYDIVILHQCEISLIGALQVFVGRNTTSVLRSFPVQHGKLSTSFGSCAVR